MMDESFLIETIKDAVCFVSQDALADLKLAHSKDSPHRSGSRRLLYAYFEFRTLTPKKLTIDWQCVMNSSLHNCALVVAHGSLIKLTMNASDESSCYQTA